MVTVNDTTLREYLRLQRRKVPPCIDEYDTFLLQLWTFFELRSAAEDYYETHRYLAKSRNAALPLPWEEIKRVLDNGGPPAQPITRIAKKNFAEVEEIIRNLRKVLSRMREKVNIGRVQQVDPHCLRWLTRQPGRNPIEKAGAKQEILGVVRVENYNTLENRVLKDFLQRCLDLCSLYIRVNERRWREHVVLKNVARFRNLCLAGLSLEAMDSIGALYETPQPNYVLQQDRLYSGIWRAYCILLKQEDVADKLWNSRADVDELYRECTKRVADHCSPRAKYHTNIWFNDIDGKRSLIENPCWENEQALSDVVEPECPNYDISVVDFSSVWDDRTVLVYPKGHPNAYPYINNPHRPSLDEVEEEVSLDDILLREDDNRLKDYLRSYYGLVGGKEWIILTPDNWGPAWIDKVRGARPTSLSSSKVFMLWRSIAAVLGLQGDANRIAGHTIMVDDGYMFPFVNHCLIKYVRSERGNVAGEVLPQRASKVLHGEGCRDGECRFWLKKKCGDERLDRELSTVGNEHLHVGFGCEDENRHHLLVAGAMRYVQSRNRKTICYFDELDPLWLVVQNRAEEVEFKPLIKHNECHPGGEEYIGERVYGGRVLMSSRKVSLNLLWGQKNDTAKLKQVEKEFDEQLRHDCDIDFEARATPGQGLATIMFSADFIEEPRLLELQNMKETDLTKARIEREMKRHFPPVMPYVEASEAIWESVRPVVSAYVNGRGIPTDNGLFAKAQPYWGPVDAEGYRAFGENRYFDEETMSPIDRLKRENVFGNAPGRDLPCSNFPWEKLFNRLARDWLDGENVLRLIAWTYRTNSVVFEPLRKQFYRECVENNSPLGPVEATFCANCFAAGDQRIACFVQCLLSRAANGGIGDNEMRLLYNLMQFHPDSLEMIDSVLCEKAFMWVYHRYNSYPFYTPYGRWSGKAATRTAGYLLKCMLFMLHRRRFDPDFLRRAENWRPWGFLAEQLPTHTTTLEGHEAMRKSFLNYVRGHGTIDGIPLGD